MIPLRPAALFRSRWAALFYAAGVLWFAADFSGTGDRDASSAASGNAARTDEVSPGNDADIAALKAQVHAFEQMK